MTAYLSGVIFVVDSQKASTRSQIFVVQIVAENEEKGLVITTT
jgi:hypothetical protein